MKKFKVEVKITKFSEVMGPSKDVYATNMTRTEFSEFRKEMEAVIKKDKYWATKKA